ncbi:MAG: SDR family NAD(P)-dependent oxidoreductase [bacterium]|nr:SDR family NAD(P)-dependent oxidoreductase [bacterium]
MKQLQNRVAVITGGASGIGRALALELAGRGCDLALVDLNRAGLDEAAERARASGRKVSTHIADVADRERMAKLPEEVLAEHGRVHILANNAGVNASGAIGEISVEDFEWVIGINFWGVVHGCHFFLPHLKQQDEAHIVNLSSMFGFIGVPESAAYCSTKFAVRGFSETLWTELAGTGVGVTSVHPGGVKTNIVRSQRTHDPENHAEFVDQFEKAARMSPEAAAKRIVRAIEKNKQRQRICAESYLTDWLKRALPNATQHLMATIYRRRGGVL